MTYDAAPPVAEGPVGDLYFVAYAAIDGAHDVLAHRFRRVPAMVTPKGAPVTAGIDLGACVWCGRLRAGKWSGLVGAPNDRVLAMAAAWVAKST